MSRISGSLTSRTRAGGWYDRKRVISSVGHLHSSLDHMYDAIMMMDDLCQENHFMDDEARERTVAMFAKNIVLVPLRRPDYVTLVSRTCDWRKFAGNAQRRF